MKFSLYSILSITLIMISCQSEPNLTERGYPIEFHVDASGPTAEIGEYVYFDLVMRSGDSVLHTTFPSDEKPRLSIPNSEQINANTPPVIDALKLMSVGDSLTLHFPLDCLKVRPPQFDNISTISYDMVMLDIKSAEAYQVEADSIRAILEEKRLADLARAEEIIDLSQQTLREYKNNSLQLETLDNGLSYIIHEAGTGPQPSLGDQVATSFDDGIPYSFQIGLKRVIQGWDVGLAMFQEGTKATLFVPSSMAYGEGGFQDIPGNTDLIFYVELDKVN